MSVKSPNGLLVRACGMTTAVGLSGAATCAALRARLDNFHETRFVSSDGDWIFGAEVPLPMPWRGLERLVHLLIGPLRECIYAAETRSTDIPVLLCVAERERAGRLDRLEEALVARISEKLGHRLHRSSRAYAFGQVSGAVALRDAGELIKAGAREVLIAGVDSFLIAETLRAFDGEDRLLTESNSNGFIAGEAGAAVLLSSGSAGLSVRGIGFGREEALISSGNPLRADGMVAAMQNALDEAGLTYNDISFRIADLSGEQYYFREVALAQARLWRGKRDPEEIWHPADGMGETGAAIIPICLGVSLMAVLNNYAPGPVILIHAAHDNGRRAAIVLSTGPG